MAATLADLILRLESSAILNAAALDASQLAAEVASSSERLDARIGQTSRAAAEEARSLREVAQTSQRCVMSELEAEVSAARAEAEGATQRLRGESAAERARIEASVRNDLAASFAHLDDKIEERIRATLPSP